MIHRAANAYARVAVEVASAVQPEEPAKPGIGRTLRIHRTARVAFAASDLDTASTSVGQRCITSLIPVDEWVGRAGLLSGAASGNENRGQRDDRSHWPVLHRPAMGGKCLAKSLPHLKGHNPRPGPFL